MFFLDEILTQSAISCRILKKLKKKLKIFKFWTPATEVNFSKIIKSCWLWGPIFQDSVTESQILYHFWVEPGPLFIIKCLLYIGITFWQSYYVNKIMTKLWILPIFSTKWSKWRHNDVIIHANWVVNDQIFIIITYLMHV